MEYYIWRLLTSMFLLLSAAVLGVFVFLFEGASVMMGLCFYGALFCALFGLAKGIVTMIDFHQEHKDQE